MIPPCQETPPPALGELHVWRDAAFRSAAENMALDEALLEWSLATGSAAIRFYHWDHAARTLGYFTRPTAPSAGKPLESPVRRFTGGGLVEHGEDLTFALAIPPRTALALDDTTTRYRRIHEALAGALLEAGVPVIPVRPDSANSQGPCFANPVPWDLLDPASGAKLAGGAQRRSRGAVLHQGSVRLPASLRSPETPWIEGFFVRLAASASPLHEEVRNLLLSQSRDLVATRYGDPTWNAGRGPLP
jgi:lipoyl(octanoyl) transferase